MIIAIDFDGTIVNTKGKPLKDSIETVKQISVLHDVILWTCREGDWLNDAVDFLKSNGIKLFAVNENPLYDSRKPLYDFLIDDRNIGTPVYFDSNGRRCVDWEKLIPILKESHII